MDVLLGTGGAVEGTPRGVLPATADICGGQGTVVQGERFSQERKQTSQRETVAGSVQDRLSHRAAS